MTAETLTLTAAATAARALGYTIRRTVDSEVVAYRKGEGVNSPAAYFTNDPADALAAVQEMARRDKLAADMESGCVCLECNGAFDLGDSDVQICPTCYPEERAAAERRARAEARKAAREEGHACEDRADAMTGEARAAELDRAADYFDKAGANPTPGGQSLGHYAARARACREEVAAIRQGIETRKRAPQRPEEGPRVIDMTPTWAGLAPALFLALTNGTPEGQRIAREELTRALAALDAHNAAAKAAQRPEMTDAQRAQISARLDRASVGNLRAYAFATLAHGQDVPEAAEDNLPGFAQPVTA